MVNSYNLISNVFQMKAYCKYRGAIGNIQNKEVGQLIRVYSFSGIKKLQKEFVNGNHLDGAENENENRLFKFILQNQQLLQTKNRLIMFKRCHSLKKSHIKIPTHLQAQPKPKHIQIPSLEADKQNMPMNRSHMYPSIQLCSSIEMAKSQTIITQKKVFRPHNPMELSGQKEGKVGIPVERVKNLCREIQEMNRKIQMYREIIGNKEMRHRRLRAKKMEEKQKVLSDLIEQFQKQKQRNNELIQELGQMGGDPFSFNEQGLEKETSSDRRTTATFNFVPRV